MESRGMVFSFSAFINLLTALGAGRGFLPTGIHGPDGEQVRNPGRAIAGNVQKAAGRFCEQDMGAQIAREIDAVAHAFGIGKLARTAVPCEAEDGGCGRPDESIALALVWPLERF